MIVTLLHRRMVSANYRALSNLVNKASLSVTLLILISLLNIFGNCYEATWHHEDWLLPSWSATETNQFLLLDRFVEVCSAVLSVAMVTEDGLSQGNSVYIHTEKIALSKLDSFFIFYFFARNNKASREWKPEWHPLFCGVWNGTSMWKALLITESI